MRARESVGEFMSQVRDEQYGVADMPVIVNDEDAEGEAAVKNIDLNAPDPLSQSIGLPTNVSDAITKMLAINKDSAVEVGDSELNQRAIDRVKQFKTDVLDPPSYDSTLTSLANDLLSDLTSMGWYKMSLKY